MKKVTGYSISQVKQNMEKFLEVSQERLRMRLKQAWKKQQPLRIKADDKLKV